MVSGDALPPAPGTKVNLENGLFSMMPLVVLGAMILYIALYAFSFPYFSPKCCRDWVGLDCLSLSPCQITLELNRVGGETPTPVTYVIQGCDAGNPSLWARYAHIVTLRIVCVTICAS